MNQTKQRKAHFCRENEVRHGQCGNPSTIQILTTVHRGAPRPDYNLIAYCLQKKGITFYFTTPTHVTFQEDFSMPPFLQRRLEPRSKRLIIEQTYVLLSSLSKKTVFPVPTLLVRTSHQSTYQTKHCHKENKQFINIEYNNNNNYTSILSQLVSATLTINIYSADII